ncbi:MAG TPA: TonB-dependent receptor [Pseudomonadales bacterium]
MQRRFTHSPRFTRRSLLLGITAAMAAESHSAFAQQLEEIVVTAERRELLLQDTPISVMAFGGEKLEASGVEDMFDLADIAPNLEIKGSRGTGTTAPTFQIRGISGGGGATGERSVGYYVDNVFMPRTTGPVMRILDVERIEVLRGPQGTLFGRNSTGGAIRVFSKQPGPEKDAYVRVTGGNFDRLDVAGMLNVPLSDNVFLRAQVASLEQDGYVRRGPQMLGSNDDEMVRLQLGWEPRADVKVNFGALYTDSYSDGSATDMIQFNMDPVCPLDPSQSTWCMQGNYADWVSDFLEQSGQPRLSHNDPRLVADDFSMPDWCFLDGPDPDWDEACRQWNTAEYKQVDMNVAWEITDALSLQSTTGISDFSSSGVTDWQLMGMEFRPSGVESDVFYQEFQFNFALMDGFADFVTGANYFREDSGSPREAVYNALGSSVFNSTTGGTAFGNEWGCAGSGTQTPLCSQPERRLRRTGDGSTQQDATAYGLFANATMHFLDERANLTLGARRSYDEKELTSTVYNSDNFIAQTGDFTAVSAKDDWSATDFRVTADFHVNDDIMLYATRSRAFRSGTFSVPAAVAPAAGRAYYLRPPLAPVPPELLYNNEVGIRSDWFDGRFRLNVTYYEMDFTNRQGASAVTDPTAPTGFVIQLVNQGDVELWGTEVEASFAVTDRLTLEAATGTANYEMENVCINNGPFLFPPPMDDSYNLNARYQFETDAGNYTFTVNNAHTGPMQTHPGGFTAEENARYNCGAFAATFIDSRYEVPSYDLVNASLRFDLAGGKWSVTLFANNLTDETYANNAQSFGRGYWTQGGPPGAAGLSAPARSAVADYRGRPREYGLTFQYNFF